MSEIDNDYIKNILYEISQSVIMPKFQKLKENDIKYKNKDKTDLVTIVDVEVEEKLKKILLNLLPNSLFVGEESYFENPSITKSYEESKFCWTVDPIDGTKNFVKGKERFAIMIGLTFKEKIIQSWIYKPLSGDLFYAIRDEGAYINGTKISSSKKNNPVNLIGSISSKYWDVAYFNKIDKLKKNFKDSDSYGCIGCEYTDVAIDVRNYMILSKLSPWDHIPGILLVKESGGLILHFDKLEYNHTLQKNNLIVSNTIELQNKIFELIEGE